MTCYKRYQYYTREGVKWTDFFLWESELRDPWQLKSQGLKNEYKEDFQS